MALSNEDILNAIAEMSVMDVVELVSAMEEKFGVSAQAAVAVAASDDYLGLAMHRAGRDKSMPKYSVFGDSIGLS
jgi:ribosomal protein L7/L12